jgi:hypothetical protein
VEGCKVGDKPVWHSINEAFPSKVLHEDFVYPPLVADPAWAERARSVILKTDAQKAEYDRKKEEIAQVQTILAQQQDELEAEERRAEERRAEERRARVQEYERIPSREFALSRWAEGPGSKEMLGCTACFVWAIPTDLTYIVF